MDNAAFSGDGKDPSPDQGDLKLRQISSLDKKPLERSVSEDAASETSSVRVGLKKKVNLVAAISLIVGTMIGSGIFISPKGVARGSGSVGLSLISWSVCGIIAMSGALCLADLGTMIKKSGCEYAYIHEAFGSLPGFLFSWTSVFLLKPGGVAIIILTCAQYVMSPFFEDDCGDPPNMNKKLTAAVCFLIIAAINCYSVKLAARVQVIFTGAKIMALLLIIIGGFVMMAQGHTQNLSNAFEGTETDVSKIAIGLYNGMWAYDGWNNLNYVTEELQNPHRNLPLAILIGIPLVTGLYLLVNISYFTVMSVPQLLGSSAVAVTWAESVIPAVKWIIPISVALSTFGATNGTLFTGGRLLFAAAREGHMVEALSYVHVKKNTPLPSLLFTSVVAVIMIIPSDIESLIDLFNFAVWMFYGTTMAALITMRFTKKDLPRPFKVPIIIPIFTMLASVFLVVAPIINDPKIEYLYAGLFILSGILFWVPFVHFKINPPFMPYITLFTQLFLDCAPPEQEPEN